MDDFQTIFDKDKRDGWKAVTRIPLSGCQVLKISTYKLLGQTSCLVTQATVCTVGDGFERYVLSYGTRGDFSKRLILSQPKRMTEAVVREQHGRLFKVEGALGALKAEIERHYAAQRQEHQVQQLECGHAV